jgi:hypothetical protein
LGRGKKKLTIFSHLGVWFIVLWDLVQVMVVVQGCSTEGCVAAAAAARDYGYAKEELLGLQVLKLTTSLSSNFVVFSWVLV